MMPRNHEDDILTKLRESSGTRNAHLSVEKRTALFNNLDERKQRTSRWIWKLTGLAALTAACWLFILSQATPEAPQTQHPQSLANSPSLALKSQSQPAPSLFLAWKEVDPVDQSIQNLQKRLENKERLALFSSRIRDSRENDLRRRLQRLRDDLS